MLKKHTDIPNSSGAYRIVNIRDGKMYVGSTKNLRKRHRDHCGALIRGVHSSRKLQREYDHNGLIYLRFEVLVICSTREDALPIEQHFINRFKPYLEDRGYNTSPTAESTLGVPCSDDKKAKIGDANRGRERSLKARTAASKWTRTRNLNATEELRKKWSAVQKKLKDTHEHREKSRIMGLNNRRISIKTIEQIVSLRDSGVPCTDLSLRFGINYTYIFELIKKFKRGDYHVKS